MNDATRPPPMDPWAPGVRANDVPVVNDSNGLPDDIFFGFEHDAQDDAEPPLAPNPRDITRHLYALFQPDFVKDYPDAWVEIAWSDPAGGSVDKAKHFSPFDLKAVAEFAEKKNAAGSTFMSARRCGRARQGRAAGLRPRTTWQAPTAGAISTAPAISTGSVRSWRPTVSRTPCW